MELVKVDYFCQTQDTKTFNCYEKKAFHAVIHAAFKV